MIPSSTRRRILGGSLASALTGLSSLVDAANRSTASGAPAAPLVRMPVLFIGHGSPMNAISDNGFTRFLQGWGSRLPKPTAILVVSAHWLTKGTTLVGAQSKPATIHDFGGFPAALQQMQYPAPGSPEMARRAASVIRKGAGVATQDWGLDHGTWTVLHHLYPKADIPVFQVSIDYSRKADFHYLIGRELAVLRNSGVLIVGSGNVVHNLGATLRGAPDSAAASASWAQQFDTAVASALAIRDDRSLMRYETLPGAETAVATPDHYFPFMYALGAAAESEPVRSLYTGFQAGTISMRCLQVGV
jgi:4,5-DOPA dioxygenase extradiol